MSKLWHRCLERLASEIPAEEVHTWLRPLQAEEVGGELRLHAPNTFVLDAVSDIEVLASNLSSKIWQKIVILDTALPSAGAAR